MAVEALRQLGGMFESVPVLHPLPPAAAAPVPTMVPLRQHICNICGESFERKTDLGNHIVCHQVDRPHACRLNNRNQLTGLILCLLLAVGQVSSGIQTYLSPLLILPS